MIYFGWSVSISGNITIIGSPFNTINENSEQRSAHVFIQNETKQIIGFNNKN
jgi:hypothetical protein